VIKVNHEIDLSKFQIRCDLISETLENNKINSLNIKKRNYKNIRVEEVLVDDNLGNEINKEKGTYTTIYFQDVTDTTNKNNVIEVLTKELKKIFQQKNLLGKKSLVVGLGNSLSTPDSLGPKTIEKIIVTRHLFNLKEIDVDEGYSNVSVFTPGVYATTGIESYETIKGIIDKTKPDVLIVIDSLASSSIENVNKVIQITDTGIEPGSGIGNNRKELSEKALSIPVIAIGIPTVVDAATIVNDTINFLIKKISYNIMNIDDPKQKLADPNTINYLNINYSLDLDERKTYLGLLGGLNDKELKELLKEVLTPIGYNFIVTPKEIDFVIDKLSTVISKAINNTLHKELKKNIK